MFGKNEIVGQKYFKDVAEDQLFVTSRFFTIQGEGPFRGRPAFFLRLAKCNLNCSFCDTFFDDGDWMTFDQIEAAIDQTINEYFDGDVPEWAQFHKGDNDIWMTGHKPRDMVLVITGGEPMLQQNLSAFLNRMDFQFEYTQIESNGTIIQSIPDCTTLVVSPKCAEKNGKPTKYLTPRHEMIRRADCLKFVMCADQNSPYSQIPAWALEWKRASKKEIFISPMNIYNDQPRKSKELRMEKNRLEIEERSNVDEVISFWTPGLLNMSENEKNHEYAARYCMQHGLTFQLQEHLYAGLA